MSNLAFDDYHHTYKDVHGNDNTTTVRAHVVTTDTAKVRDTDGRTISREVATRTGSVTVKPGDVMIETERPGQYDVQTADEWAGSYGAHTVAEDDDE
jgi:hypothetical protein